MNKLNNIQGLRFVAFVLIFINHSYYFISNTKLFDFGARGVEIFFVLSGYLVAYKYANSETSYSLKSSFRYVLKKLKNFYVLHIIGLLMALYFSQFYIPSIKSLLLNIFLLQSWYSPEKFSFNGVSWFLSAILFCWFFVPQIVHFFNKKSQSFLFFSFLIIALLKLSGDALVLSHKIELPQAISIYSFPPYRLLDFLLGYLSYLLMKDLEITHTPVKTSILQVIFLACLIFVYIALDRYWLYAQYLLFAAILVYLVNLKGGVLDYLLGNRIFVYLGNISFELYIFHQLILNKLNSLYEDKITVIWLSALISFILAEIFAYKPIKTFITQKIWTLPK